MKRRRQAVLRWEWVAIGAILIAAALLRAGYFNQVLGERPLHVPVLDAAFNHYWAKGIVTGDWTVPGGCNDPLIRMHPFGRPPGYAYFLAGIYAVAGVDHLAAILVQMALGLVNVVLAWRIGRWVFGRAAGLLAAAIMGSYWLLIDFEGELLDPTLTIALALLTALAVKSWLERPRWGLALAAGLLLGLLALVRPNFLPLAPLMAAGLFFRRLPRGARPFHLAALAVGVAAAILPVTLRNWRVGGELALISTNAGVNLYIGNNPESDLESPVIPGIEKLTHNPSWSQFDDLAIVRGLEGEFGRRIGFAGASRYFSAKAWGYMKANPGRTLSRTARRAVRMLGPVEYSNNKMLALEREASPLLSRLPGNFPAVFILAAIGFAQWFLLARRSPIRPPGFRPRHLFVCWMLAFLAVLYGSYLLFFIEARYRIPMLPFLAIGAGFGGFNLACLAIQCKWKPLAGWIAVNAVACALLWWPTAGYAPNRAYWHYLRATQYAGDRDVARFAAELEQAYRYDPDDPVITMKLGRARYYQGRRAESVELLRKSLAIKPDVFETCLSLGYALLDDGRLEEAAQALGRAVRLQPGDDSARVGLARALRLQGRTPAEIQSALDEAINPPGTKAP
ncbi:MAG: glycosyltransferase family 39 protein [Candidatus Sumerlaeia bacterium]